MPRTTTSTYCWELTDLDTRYPIRLNQAGPDDFIVTYGREVRAGLTYGQAAQALGNAILHALACNDKIDNRSAAEAAAESEQS